MQQKQEACSLWLKGRYFSQCYTAHIHTCILLSCGSANPQEIKGGSHCSLIPVSCCGGSFGAWWRDAGPVDAPTHSVLDRSTDVTQAKPP